MRPPTPSNPLQLASPRQASADSLTCLSDPVQPHWLFLPKLQPPPTGLLKTNATSPDSVPPCVEGEGSIQGPGSSNIRSEAVCQLLEGIQFHAQTRGASIGQSADGGTALQTVPEEVALLLGLSVPSV